MSTVGLAIRQARYENRAFWRNPAAAFFTFVFPLMFLVIFNVVFGDRDIEVEGGTIDTSTFYVPAILAMSIINACFTAIAQIIAFQRDRGVLKRLRGTPLPGWAYLAGRIGHAILVALLLVVIVVAFGVVLYGVDLQSEKLPAMAVAILVGAGAFCALGMAMTAFIPNADAAPAVVNAVILPLLFISDVFIPDGELAAMAGGRGLCVSRQSPGEVDARGVQPPRRRQRLRRQEFGRDGRLGLRGSRRLGALLQLGATQVARQPSAVRARRTLQTGSRGLAVLN